MSTSTEATRPAEQEPAETAPRQPSWLTRALWFSAGADESLLRRCPTSDWVKYQSIGGIVVATSLLAFVSSAYALYTVFSPKTDTALQLDTHLPTALFSALGGALWSLVIFNIDRFIVSSTGKGDGTERITLRELGQSLPRLLMAGIIGVCISAPLEIRILKPEIDAQLELEQIEYLRKLNQHAENQVQARREDLTQKIDRAQTVLADKASYFEQRRLEINAQRRALELEAEGKTGSGASGRGPAWRDKKETLDKLEAELERDKTGFADKERLLSADITAWTRSMEALAAELKANKDSNLRQSRHLDGLLKRIHISHSIGGLVPWAILLLLLAVETGPIFFKMMLVQSAYDYQLENQKRVAAARLGIELDAQLFVTENNEEVRLDVYHQVESALAEARRKLASEQALARALHERFKDDVARQLAELELEQQRKAVRGS